MWRSAAALKGVAVAMRRVECTGMDHGSIMVDADKILYCQRARTNSGQPFIEIYFSTEPEAWALCVLELATTMNDLMPRGEK